jgi:transcriptional regulator with XRE-family HTH domain
MPDFGVRIGRRIRRVRKERGMTQTELARALNVADAQVSRWETGRVVPQRRNLEALAAALGVQVEAFLMDPKKDDRD